MAITNEPLVIFYRVTQGRRPGTFLIQNLKDCDANLLLKFSQRNKDQSRYLFSLSLFLLL